MGLTAWLVIMPLSHYWVLFKLLLTTVATGVLLLKLQPISYLAEAARSIAFSSDALVGLRTSLTIHAAGGLLILLAAIVLAIYKPVGLTAYGARRRDVKHTTVPGWAKVLGIVLAALLTLISGMALLGSHGPGAHVPIAS